MCYQTAQRHERNLKFLSEGSQFVKATSVWSQPCDILEKAKLWRQYKKIKKSVV